MIGDVLTPNGLTCEFGQKPADPLLLDNQFVRVTYYGKAVKVEGKDGVGNIRLGLEITHPFDPPILLGDFPFAILHVGPHEIQFLFEGEEEIHTLKVICTPKAAPKWLRIFFE